MKPNAKNSPPHTPTKIIATGSASIAALLAASANQADAQIVHLTAGFTVDNNTNYNWDVDSHGGTDFTFRDTSSYDTTAYITFQTQALTAPANEGRWMANGSNKLAALATTAMVSAGANFKSPGAYISNYGNLAGC